MGWSLKDESFAFICDKNTVGLESFDTEGTSQEAAVCGCAESRLHAGSAGFSYSSQGDLLGP